jgi:hypothetical protein
MKIRSTVASIMNDHARAELERLGGVDVEVIHAGGRLTRQP